MEYRAAEIGQVLGCNLSSSILNQHTNVRVVNLAQSLSTQFKGFPLQALYNQIKY